MVEVEAPVEVTGTSNPTLPSEAAPEDRAALAKSIWDAAAARKGASAPMIDVDLASVEAPAPRDESGKFKSADEFGEVFSRYKLPESALKSMSEDERRGLGESLKQQRAESDRMATELATFKKKTEIGKPTTDAATEQAAAHPASTGTLREATAQIGQLLGLDESESQVIEKAFGSVVAPLVAENRALTEQMKSLGTQYDSVGEMVSYAIAGIARSQLEGEFPGLKDSESYSKVRDEMVDATSNPKYGRIADPMDRVRQIMRDSCVLVFEKDILRKARSDGKRQGQPSFTDIRSNVKSRFAGIPDHEARFKLLTEGKTPDEVRALLGNN